MSPHRSIKQRLGRLLRHVLSPIIGGAVVAYFAYYTVQGDRGLTRLTQLQGEVAEAEAELAAVQARRETLEHQARLLRPDHLDPDMLEERARMVLNMVHPDELVILTPAMQTTPVSRQ